MLRCPTWPNTWPSSPTWWCVRPRARSASPASRWICSAPSLRIAIPDIARKATRAELREYPRYDIDTRARVEFDGRSFDARVFDISESGALIENLPGLAIGTKLVLTLPAFHPVAGKVVRAGEQNSGVGFEPQKLKTEEVRRLIVAAAA